MRRRWVLRVGTAGVVLYTLAHLAYSGVYFPLTNSRMHGDFHRLLELTAHHGWVGVFGGEDLDLRTRMDLAPQQVLAADFDGRPGDELAVISRANEVQVFTTRAGRLRRVLKARLEGHWSAWTAGDLDGDGRPELLVATQVPEQRQWALSAWREGRPQLDRLGVYELLESESPPRQLLVRDLNGDGMPELVTGAPALFRRRLTLPVLRREPSGAWAFERLLLDPRPAQPFWTDLDGDGVAEVVTVQPGTRLITVSKLQGDRYQPVREFALPRPVLRPEPLPADWSPSTWIAVVHQAHRGRLVWATYDLQAAFEDPASKRLTPVRQAGSLRELREILQDAHDKPPSASAAGDHQREFDTLQQSMRDAWLTFQDLALPYDQMVLADLDGDRLEEIIFVDHGRRRLQILARDGGRYRVAVTQYLASLIQMQAVEVDGSRRADLLLTQVRWRGAGQGGVESVARQYRYDAGTLHPVAETSVEGLAVPVRWKHIEGWFAPLADALQWQRAGEAVRTLRWDAQDLQPSQFVEADLDADGTTELVITDASAASGLIYGPVTELVTRWVKRYPTEPVLRVFLAVNHLLVMLALWLLSAALVPPGASRTRFALLLAVLWYNFAPLYSSLGSVNIETWQLGLLSAALYCFVRERRALTGVLVGLAVGIKILPALLLPYFWLKGERRALAAGFATLGLIALATVWWLHVPLVEQASFLGVGKQILDMQSLYYQNQSLYGMVVRFFSAVDLRSAEALQYPALSGTARAVGSALAGLLSVALLMLQAWLIRRAPAASAAPERAGMQRALEFAMVLLTTILVCPSIHHHYFIFALPAISVGAACYLHHVGSFPKAKGVWWLAAAYLLMGWVVPLSLFDRWWPHLLPVRLSDLLIFFCVSGAGAIMCLAWLMRVHWVNRGCPQSVAVSVASRPSVVEVPG
ncbi:MAG: DUF2029 domain-containing protein [Candidatus Omnitrophica bacterium]|nr:DUF2029 domain-containing protein [Candidatus Omnitrophota bacterium]